MSKKICIFTSQHKAIDPRIFFREARSLAKAGFHVHIFGDHPEDSVIEGIHIHAMPPFRNKILNKILPFLVFPFKIIPLNAHIYHFHDPDLIPCGVFLRMLGKKVIMDVHEDFKSTLLTKREYIPKRFRRLISSTLDFIEKRAARIFSGIVVVSQEIAEKFDSSPIAVVRNFPPVTAYDKLDEVADDDNFNIIYSGGVAPVRGCWQILDAFEIFKKMCPSARLIIIGAFSSSELESKFRLNADRIGSVDVRGELPWNDVIREQRKANIGILITFFQTDSKNEAYPMKLFEYLAASLPVVISKKPFFIKMLAEGNFGIMVDGENPNEIAAAFFELYTDEEKRKRMAVSGRKYVENNFSWENEFKNLSELYRQVLN